MLIINKGKPSRNPPINPRNPPIKIQINKKNSIYQTDLFTKRVYLPIKYGYKN